MNPYTLLIRPLLFTLEPERAHECALGLRVVGLRFYIGLCVVGLCVGSLSVRLSVH